MKKILTLILTAFITASLANICVFAQGTETAKLPHEAIADFSKNANVLLSASEFASARSGGLLNSISIMEAMSSLAEIGGREVREDVISEIFSRFCVGK